MTEGLIGGLVVALVAAPMGCFILWRRMVFFGAAVSHSALLGVALGLALGINVTAGVVLTAAAVAVMLVILRRDKRLADDTILGVVAHGALALGLIALAFLKGPGIDLEAVLFGDIGSITRSDLVWIFAGGDRRCDRCRICFGRAASPCGLGCPGGPSRGGRGGAGIRTDVRSGCEESYPFGPRSELVADQIHAAGQGPPRSALS